MRKYGGSALWALLIYRLVAVLLPARAVPAGLVATALAFAVEFGKLIRTPDLDAFRHTLPGKLLLGSVFSGWDLLAYAVAIGGGVALDTAARRRSKVRGDR